ncbi:cytochrome c oxidase subunit II [Jannaschia formosa]|uniref:cytochrome c oxidase subunit II n=1 Tax=Jannaschia formosa TaxID=2259592 RepID=UPI00142F9E3F|nr:c-type cytochrome [Jannaschia formosa]
MASLGWWMFASAIFVLIVTLGLVLVGANLHRRGEPRRISFRASVLLVVAGGVAAPLLAIVAVAISGVVIGDEVEGPGGADGPWIEVRGELWWWEFRYLDEDGEVVAVTANELHLPVGRRARLRLVSDNVIHSFWAPNLQGKTDLIPGKVNLLYAEPETPGTWRGQCAEFCGLQHGLMGFVVVAEPPGDFARWLAAQAEPHRVTEPEGLAVFDRIGCAECHTVRGTSADGEDGPDLTHLASRQTLAAATIPNSRGNLGGWITSTHTIKPGAKMPSRIPEPEDLHALLDFLESLE